MQVHAGAFGEFGDDCQSRAVTLPSPRGPWHEECRNYCLQACGQESWRRCAGRAGKKTRKPCIYKLEYVCEVGIIAHLSIQCFT